MSILFICNNKDPRPWSKALAEFLPKEKIEIYPEVENDDEVDFIICWRPAKNIFKRYRNLKAVQSLGASVNHIFDTNRLGDKVQVARIVDEQLSEDIWEYTLTAVLSHIKNFNLYKHLKQTKVWNPLAYTNINNTTVSILGLGAIGGYAAAKFAAAGFITKGWSLSKKKIKNVKSYTGKAGLKKMLKDTDVLINILPLTKLTKGILNNDTLGRLNRGSYLINVGRGEHLVEKHLLQQIKKCHLSGAMLDVFSDEPLPKEHPFWTTPEIDITPHTAAITNINSAISQIVENYKRFKRRKKLLNVVSVKKGY